MKKIYVLLILLIISFSNSFAQLTIVDAVAVDGNSDGYYGTIEIKFSAPVNDTEVLLSAVTQAEWDFSLDPTFSTDVKSGAEFHTDVNVIASENVANDSYIRIITNSQFASCNGPIYIRYTNDNPTVDSISAYYTPADILADEKE